MILSNLEIDISVKSNVWDKNFPNYNHCIENCFQQIMSHVAEARRFDDFSQIELSILLTDDHEVHILNQEYRGKDKATNVLSFPSLDEEEIEQFLRTESDIPAYPISLGDIIFAYETIASEAKEQGKSLSDHFSHLCIHGMLHLLGYDHIIQEEAMVMEGLEKSLLSKLSIDDPYQD